MSPIQKLQNLDPVDHAIFHPAPVVGVDEVGRGCLAGPVYAGAVCLRSGEHLAQLTDSKLLSEKRRDEIAPLIHELHWVGIGTASVEEIDRINILQASFLAMKRAIQALELQMGKPAGHVVVDGNQRIPGFSGPQTTLIKGDLRCLPISAASIAAKVARDGWMRDLAGKFPGYGFEKHKGYASAQHRTAIAKLGPTIWHRQSFRGVKEFLPVRS